jgi:two-component system chemotaxis sensor kinase CheA
LVINPNTVAEQAGLTRTHPPTEADETTRAAAPTQRMAVLVFRAGSPELKAVPLSLVSRVEGCEASDIGFANGRWVMRLRGKTMPLICLGDETRLKSKWPQRVLVFSHHNRSVGLVIDEVVDLVEDTLEFNLEKPGNGTLGAVLVRGTPTDVIDVAQLLPFAAGDHTLRLAGDHSLDEALTASLLLVEDAAFFRNMLTPVLKTAGYQVTGVGRAEQALELIRNGQRFAVIVSAIDLPGMNGFAFAEVLRGNPLTAKIPLVGLCSMVAPGAIDRGRHSGFRVFVAKFDREGLIAALKSTTVDRTEAA